MRRFRTLSLLLLLCMVFGMMVPSAFAAEDGNYDAKLQIFEDILVQKKGSSSVSQPSADPYQQMLVDIKNSGKAKSGAATPQRTAGIGAASTDVYGIVSFRADKAAVAPGDTFRVKVYVQSTDLYGLSLNLLFDPSIARMVSAKPLNNLRGTDITSYPLTTLVNSFEDDETATNVSGHYDFAATITGSVASTAEVRYGDVLELTFQAVSAGQFNIHATNDDSQQLSTSGYNALVKLSDSNAIPIVYDVEDLNLPLETPEYQVTLTWDSGTPEELDLHGWVKFNNQGPNVHVSWLNSGNKDFYPYMTYSYDDYGTTGREDIQIHDFVPTNYYFAVHSYFGTPLGNFNHVTVNLYREGELIQSFPINLEAASGKTFWGVFTLTEDESGNPVITEDHRYTTDHVPEPPAGVVPVKVNFDPESIPDKPSKVSFLQEELPEPFDTSSEQFPAVVWLYNESTHSITPVLETLFTADPDNEGYLVSDIPALAEGEYFISIHTLGTALDESIIGYGYIQVYSDDSGFFGTVPHKKTVRKGEQFTIDVAAENIPDVYSAQFKLLFDPSMLQVVELAAGDLISGENTQTIIEQFDNVEGTIQFARTYLGEASTKDHGVLATITFKAAEDIGEDVSTYLEFDYLAPNGSVVKLMNPDGEIDPDTYTVGGSVITIKASSASITGYAKLDVPRLYDYSGIHVTLLDDNGDVIGQTYTLEDGSFTIGGIEPNVYSIQLKKNGYLLRVINDVQVEPGENNISTYDLPIKLWAGDVNDDDKIDISDFSIVAGAFFTFSGQEGFIASADYNMDGFIDLSDIHSIAVHYFTTPDKYIE